MTRTKEFWLRLFERMVIEWKFTERTESEKVETNVTDEFLERMKEGQDDHRATLTVLKSQHRLEKQVS